MLEEPRMAYESIQSLRAENYAHNLSQYHKLKLHDASAAASITTHLTDSPK